MTKTMKFAFLMVSLFFAWNTSAQESSSQTTRAKVVASAKQYLGRPYQSGAIGPDKFDCSGFVYRIMQDVAGIQMPRSAKAIYSKVRIIKNSEAKKGDLVFFKTTGNGTISHVGIYIGKNQFIHAASDGSKTGVIVSSLDEKYYAKCYAGVGRILP